MKVWKATMGIVVPAFALGACAVLPAYDAEVDDARAAVLAAQNDPQVVSLAPVELHKAVDAMREADAAWSNRSSIEEVHHLAYLARTHATIAKETARLKTAEASVASANAERDRVRLKRARARPNAHSVKRRVPSRTRHARKRKPTPTVRARSRRSSKRPMPRGRHRRHATRRRRRAHRRPTRKRAHSRCNRRSPSCRRARPTAAWW